MTATTAPPANSNSVSATPGIFNMSSLSATSTTPPKRCSPGGECLDFGIWNLFGIWSLVLGISLPPLPATALPSLAPLPTRPLYFEAGPGQADAAPQFAARGPNYQFLLTPTQTRLVLSKPSGGAPASPRGREPSFLSGSTVARMVQMEFVGANPHALIQGTRQLPRKINYLVANDPGQCRSGVAT